MYTLKKKPEDFIVREVSNVSLGSGKYTYFKLTKRNRNTLDVVKELSRQLNMKMKDIGFAGSKDKHAITEQLISVAFGKKELNVDIDGVEFEFIGYGPKPISLGDLKGNKFEIVISDYKGKILEVDFCENYFDEQRFSKSNAAIGKAFVTKDFKKACSLIDSVGVVENNNYIGALQKVPRRLLRMFVNAYQSYLWNETVAQILLRRDVVKKVKYSLGEFIFVSSREDFKVPLVGFASKEFETPEIKKILEKEGIRYKDFIIKQFPQLSLEGDMRDVFIDVKEMKVDGHKVSFFLQKGSYATMVVRKITV